MDQLFWLAKTASTAIPEALHTAYNINLLLSEKSGHSNTQGLTSILFKVSNDLQQSLVQVKLTAFLVNLVSGSTICKIVSDFLLNKCDFIAVSAS